MLKCLTGSAITSYHVIWESQITLEDTKKENKYNDTDSGKSVKKLRAFNVLQRDFGF